MEPEPITPEVPALDAGNAADRQSRSSGDENSDKRSELKSQASELVGQFGSLMQRDLARIRASIAKRNASND